MIQQRFERYSMQENSFWENLSNTQGNRDPFQEKLILHSRLAILYENSILPFLLGSLNKVQCTLYIIV
jgi:hypothetical protein